LPWVLGQVIILLEIDLVQDVRARVRVKVRVKVRLRLRLRLRVRARVRIRVRVSVPLAHQAHALAVVDVYGHALAPVA